MPLKQTSRRGGGNVFELRAVRSIGVIVNGCEQRLPEDVPVRIGTWNLDHARARKHDAERLRVLHEADADVWVLTETNDRVELEGYVPTHSRPRPSTTTGGRWVTIWSRLAIARTIDVADPNRCAATLLTAPGGEILVFGAVVPWHADVGEPPRDPRPRMWQEQYRVLPLLSGEWQRLQASWPNASLYVAGDINLSLGGPHFYGTARGRGLLEAAMESCRLECATCFDRVPAGALKHPAIDHVLLPRDMRSEVVAAWEGTTCNGVKLSDHSGLVVEVV